MALEQVTIETDSGNRYVGYLMGTGSHGNPDVGFEYDVLSAMIDAGDTQDSNGGGIRWDIAGTFVDVYVDTPEAITERVPVVFVGTQMLYVPQGRAWEIPEP